LKKLFLSLILLISFNSNAQNLKGSVLNQETGQGLPFAKIYCLETQNGATADSNGVWYLNNVIDNKMTLQISANEYESKIIIVDNYDSEITVKLEYSHIHLDEVIVSTSDSKLQRYSAFPVESRKIADLNKIEQTNLVDAMSNIPGIIIFLLEMELQNQ
jgi:iron complex outermembrane receptor protein